MEEYFKHYSITFQSNSISFVLNYNYPGISYDWQMKLTLQGFVILNKLKYYLSLCYNLKYIFDFKAKFSWYYAVVYSTISLNMILYNNNKTILHLFQV